MAKHLMITGTDTGVGKTFVGCSLAFAFNSRGLRVGVMKPAETGCEERGGKLYAADAEALALAASSNLDREKICPYRSRLPLAPAAAAEQEHVSAPQPDAIAQLFAEIKAHSDAVIVEGAGGLTVPITWKYNYADLATDLDLETIVVVSNRLGCLNATLLTLDYAARRDVRVLGYILNDVQADDSPAAKSNAQSLARLTPVQCLGSIGFKAPMARTTVERILEA